MRRRKTQQEFINELKLANSTIKCIDEYKTMHEKIKFKCLTCGYEWYDTPGHVLYGRGCHNCNRKIRKTHECFIAEVKSKFSNIDILSKYSGVDNKIKCHCKIHNIDWLTTPFVLLRGNYGCRLCANESIKKMKLKTHDEFCKEVNKSTYGEYSVVGKYIDSKTAIIMHHKTCGNDFFVRPSNFLINRSCPHCVTPSKGEYKIIDFFEQHDINHEFQKYYDDLRGINNGQLSYDFYVDKFNLLIEYQGEFHDGTLLNKVQTIETYDRQQEHDKRKREYAKSHNINLLEIWYWDFDNIENILARELGIPTSLAS